jgi:hypothetical protein
MAKSRIGQDNAPPHLMLKRAPSKKNRPDAGRALREPGLGDKKLHF